VTTGSKHPVIALTRVSKQYGAGDTAVHAVAGVDLVVEHGDYLAVMGASGSGKSTLMHILGLLDEPSRGLYRLDGTDTRRLDERQKSFVRNRKIGFVFQSFNLIPRASALANVELPLAYAGVGRVERRARALAALDRVGLADRVGHLPTELSGGQQQRVAIARALGTRPDLVFADEPTGNLDSRSGREVLALLAAASSDYGQSIAMVTHDPIAASYADRIVFLADGAVVEERPRSTAEEIGRYMLGMERAS